MLNRGVRAILTIAAALLLTVAVRAQDRPALDLRQFTLGNGLHVILVADRSAPTVAVNVTYDVGAIDDPTGRNGFAHLFEHLMFEQTAHLETGELDRLVESVGGYLNAYTDIERTVYYTALPAHQLPLALWYEADRMASLVINGENFANQRAIVVEEYNQNVFNAPYGEAFEYLFTLPYSVAPYRQRVIGTMADLNAAGVADAIAFHERYYLPNNAVLTVAGDIDFAEAESLVRRAFDPIPAGAEPPTPDLTPGAPQAARYDFLDPLASVPAYLVGYPVPARGQPDFAAIEILASVLAGGDSSRLALALYNTGLAVDLGALPIGNRAEGLLTLYAFANGGVSALDLEAVINDHIRRIIDEGVTPGELTKAVNGIRAGRISAIETAEGLAETVQTGYFYYNDPNGAFNEIERYAQVTADDVRRVAQTYLDPARAVVLLVEPTIEGTSDTSAPVAASADPAALDADLVSTPRYVQAQSEPPPPLAIRPFTLPPISETRLDNGLTVIAIPRPEVPIVLLSLVLPGGGAADPAAQSGLAEIAAAMVTRGTTTRSASAIANAIESVGGAIGANITDDALSIGAFALRSDAALAFQLLADSAINPIFPDTEFAIAQQNLLTDIETTQADGPSLAGQTMLTLLYGDHPYGTIATPDTVIPLTVDMVRFFYSTQAQPGRAFLIVSGALTADEAVALARDHFGGWVGSNAPFIPAIPEPAPTAAPGIYLIDRPGSVQADMVIGALGVTGADPARDALTLMNTVLGGTFGARLGRVIREELGYTYGIYSTVTYPVGRGALMISSSVGNEYAGPALTEVFNQLALLRDQPVPPEELADVLSGMVAGQALAYETAESVVAAVGDLRLIGLPPSEISDAVTRGLAVDAAAVQNAAAQFYATNRLYVVVVGDAATLQPALSAVGPVTLLEEAP